MWKRDQSVNPTSAPAPPPVAAVPAQPQPQPVQPTQAAVKPAEKPGIDLGTSVVIKGELSASEDLTLCGRLEGSVRLPEHTLTIGATAEVKAEIVAKTVDHPRIGHRQRHRHRTAGCPRQRVADWRCRLAAARHRRRRHAARQGADDGRIDRRIPRFAAPQGRSGRLTPSGHATSGIV